MRFCRNSEISCRSRIRLFYHFATVWQSSNLWKRCCLEFWNIQQYCARNGENIAGGGRHYMDCFWRNCERKWNRFIIQTSIIFHWTLIEPAWYYDMAKTSLREPFIESLSSDFWIYVHFFKRKTEDFQSYKRPSCQILKTCLKDKSEKQGLNYQKRWFLLKNKWFFYATQCLGLYHKRSGKLLKENWTPCNLSEKTDSWSSLDLDKSMRKSLRSVRLKLNRLNRLSRNLARLLLDWESWKIFWHDVKKPVENLKNKYEGIHSIRILKLSPIFTILRSQVHSTDRTTQRTLWMIAEASIFTWSRSQRALSKILTHWRWNRDRKETQKTFWTNNFILNIW